MRFRPMTRAVQVLCAMILASCPFFPDDPEITAGSIAGFARYSAQEDHSGITVSAEPQSGVNSVSSRRIAGYAATDGDGAYSLGDLEAGTYTLYASSPDSIEQAVTTAVVVEAGRVVSAADLNLTPTGSIRGRATLAGATSGNLGILAFLAGTSYSAMTDDAGDYRFDRVPAGSGYTLVVAMDGYDQVVSTVAVAPGAETNAGAVNLIVHVTPAATGSIAGYMYLGGMTTHAGVFVYLSGTSHITMTDGYGSFLLEGVPPGMYVLMANKHGFYPAATQYVTITAGTTISATARTLSPEAAAVPVITPGTGTYEADTTVQFSTATSGATIWVTTDGSWPAPASGSSFEAASIVVTKDGETVVRAMCARTGMANSGTRTVSIEISRPWISYGAEGAGPGQFDHPWGVARDSTGRIHVVDQYNHRIVRMDDLSGTNWTSYGTQGSGTGNFYYPLCIAFDSQDRIHVSDYVNDRLVRIDDMAGTGWTAFSSAGTPETTLYCPTDLTIDAADRIYIADSGHHRIVRIDDLSGTGWASFGSQGSGTYQFREPQGGPIGPDGYLYHAETGNDRIVRVADMTGSGYSSVGAAGTGGNQFYDPRGIAVDQDGAIYIADTGNYRIVRYNGWAYGWRTFGTFGYGDGQFFSPMDCFVDEEGRVYVGDMGNHSVVRFKLPLF